MRESICEGRLCTGCAACSQVCPQGAVAMNESEEGFLYPKINGGFCNDCGLCARTCPINAACEDGKKTVNSGTEARKTEFNDLDIGKIASDDFDAGKFTSNGSEAANQSAMLQSPLPGIQHKAYACYSLNPEIRAKSSSGGVFTQLAIKILSENGVVFGAGFDEDFTVRHRYIDNKDELDGLRRSKYVQSDTAATFREARAFLREGRPVMYCGTPCQIAGLKAYLGRDYENLLACDLACHGVPSPKVWQMFLGFLKNKYKSNVKAVSFRDKSTGWNNSSMKIDFENGSRYIDQVKREIFFIGFGKSIFNRRSCYDCKFRIDKTKADITLADFWGIDRQKETDYKDNKGVSLIITHTAAGEKALSRVSGEICMKQRSLDEAIRYNPRLVSSVGEPAGRRSFFGDMESGFDFDRLRRKYMDNSSMKYKAKTLVKRMLGRG